ncbi:MAG: hypothetical protein Q9195_001116 [Heterodermia aff. obscurata]
MADPGPQWLIWAHQMKTHHSDLAKQVQQVTDATTRNIEGHSDLVKQVQQNADAIAQQRNMSHSALHEETKTIRGDLQLLSRNLGELEKRCDTEFRNLSRRVTNLEEQAGTLLDLVERCKSTAETALQRQGQETPELWMQQAHDLTRLKEHQRRENADRKNEIEESAGISPSQGPINGTLVSDIDDTTNFEPDAFPMSQRHEHHTQQSDSLITQDFYELDEYLMISGEAICSKLREYEKNLIKQFIQNMSNADQKATLVESLNRKGWTWKSAEEATNTICLAEREKREADEARRIAAEETAHKARQPLPKANTQRRKRKKKNW